MGKVEGERGGERFGERCHGEKRNMAVGVGLGPKDPSRVCRAQCFVPPTIGQGFNEIRSRLGEGWRAGGHEGIQGTFALVPWTFELFNGQVKSSPAQASTPLGPRPGPGGLYGHGRAGAETGVRQHPTSLPVQSDTPEALRHNYVSRCVPTTLPSISYSILSCGKYADSRAR
jgi:hypothetical protein